MSLVTDIAMSDDRNDTTARGPRDVALSVRGISHAFVTPGATEPTLVLDEVSFDVHRSEFVALVGPSGCGKTTVLNMAAGLIRPMVGEVVVDDERVLRPSRQVGYMFARDGLLPWRSATRNVEMGLEMRGVPAKDRRAKAAELLKMVGLSGFEQAYPGQLSHGMRQRAAIARTLATDPDVLLMDEPFAALDAQTRISVQSEFSRIVDGSGTTVMFVTHDLNESVLMADRIIVFTGRPGRIYAEIPVTLPRPRDTETLRFTDEYQDLCHQVWTALKEAQAEGKTQ